MAFYGMSPANPDREEPPVAESANPSFAAGAGPSARAAALAAAVVGCVVLVHWAWWAFADTGVHRGGLGDSDTYVRMVRIERLIGIGDWFDAGLPRANAPEGVVLHWTRPLDALIVALPIEPFLGLSRALYWAGALVSPLLHAAAALALMWAVRPLIGVVAAAVAGGLTALQFGVLGYAMLGRADHHVLLALFAVLAFGFTVRALLADRGVRPAALAGGALALGLWVGTEAQIPAALSMIAVGLTWIAGDDRGADKSLALALGFVGGLALATLIERGPGLLAVEYDRVSIVHVTQAALVAAFWSVVMSLRRRAKEPEGPMTRLLVAVGGAAVMLAVMRIVFPKVLVNPLMDVDPVVREAFHKVAEYAPIADASHFMLYVGAALFALPWSMKRLQDNWRARERWPWLLLVASSAVYLALTMNWIRWCLYAGFFLAIGLADLIRAVDAAIDRRLPSPGRVPLKVLAVLALAVGPLAAGTVGVYRDIQEKEAASGRTAADDACPVGAMAKFLETPPWREPQHTILASVNFGGEILYRTRHRVTAIIHHRSAAGIKDGIRILGGADEREILDLIRQREIDLILLCRRGGDDAYFWKGRGENVFYRRLETGDLPAWLDEVALPKDLGRDFRLYRVAPPG